MAKPRKTEPTKARPKPLARNNTALSFGEERLFVCSACGNEYLNQEQNFMPTPSPFYFGNNNRLTVCNQCVKEFAMQYVDILKDPIEAIKTTCMHLDLYVDNNVIRSIGKYEDSKQIVCNYFDEFNNKRFVNKTYDDYLDELKQNAVSYANQSNYQPQHKSSLATKQQIDEWGAGFLPEEYNALDEHYKYLSTQKSSDDPVQDIYIRDMCEMKILQTRALESGKMDDWAKYKKLYQDTAKSAKLNPAQTKGTAANSEDESWGMFIADVERYAPAEYYKNKKIFADGLNIGEYIERFLLRPVRNLLMGTKDLDDEYRIEEDTGGGDGS